MAADAGSPTDARVMDARAIDAPAERDASAVMDAQVTDAQTVDARVDADAQITPGLCCGASGVTSDCTEDCVPVGVSFERMWPCPADTTRCTQSVRFDGKRAAIVDHEGTRTGDYACLGSVLVEGSSGALLGRYDEDTGLLLFEGDSFCASERCRALWQRDGCVSLFDGRWQGPSTGCLEEDDFEPRGCPYQLTFERTPRHATPSPQAGPVCIVWGDDFDFEAPLTCDNNIGTCNTEPLRVHPTLGIEYQGRWHPSSIVPCEELVGAWIATACACSDDTMDPTNALCAPRLRVEVSGAATLSNSVDSAGGVRCTGNDFVFSPDNVGTPPSPPGPDLSEFARGEIDVATDTLSVYWHHRQWTFARAAEQ